jgi:hypothetical protein
MDPSPELIEVQVSALVRDANTDAPVVLLQLVGTKRHMPIWIGDAEANAIAMVMAGRKFERPLTHDLMQQLIDGLGGTLERVVITEIEGNTYFARLHLTRGHEIISVDARPSDSVALAMRCRAPIYLSRELAESQADNFLEVEASQDNEKAVEDLIRDVEKGIGRDEPPPENSEDEED